MTTRYDEPNLAARAFNEVFRWLAEAGIGIAGTRALRVRGRKTGKRRGVVVNLLTVDGRDYLVSPRGNTQWARNARAAGEVEMGPRWRSRDVRIVELADDAKPELLKRYLERWYWEVKGHVGGLTPESTDAELRAAAPSIPVFELFRARRRQDPSRSMSHDGLGGCLSHVAGQLKRLPLDGLVDRGSGQHHAVADERELLADVGGGVPGERRTGAGVHGQLDAVELAHRQLDRLGTGQVQLQRDRAHVVAGGRSRSQACWGWSGGGGGGSSHSSGVPTSAWTTGRTANGFITIAGVVEVGVRWRNAAAARQSPWPGRASRTAAERGAHHGEDAERRKHGDRDPSAGPPYPLNPACELLPGATPA